MGNNEPLRVTALRAVITDFLAARYKDKLEAVKEDVNDPDAANLQREKLRQQFIPATWLEDAARRAAQIQAVTHSLKPVHPDAKGSNLFVSPTQFEQLQVVGSHCLTIDFAVDFVCDAKLLPIVAFLKLEHEGSSLLSLAVAGDPDFALALSDDTVQAMTWLDAFASLAKSRGRLSSHTLAKQVYWQCLEDAEDNASFHLLAPLYATSLAHRVFEAIKEDDNFNDAVKAARKAMKENTYSERPVRVYPQLAIQQLGGSNTQNISHLNSKRRGENRLLASLPPVWRSMDLKPLLNTDSMFHRYSRRPEVRQSVKALLAFLKTDSTRNVATRSKRAAWVYLLIDEFLQFTAELRSLEPGWSQTSQCKLTESECRWLDDDGVKATDAELDRSPPTDIPERISAAFANWLNAQLRPPLPMGDPEFLAWRNTMQEEIKAQEREGTHVE
ncbi:MAG: type I-F CRISPR-associated protein Csy1 [Rhodoferax sp.]|uniref:type I-F CRISPR-associated protein Csy1 n=1 Tax=Rhodoferax sp. TaxID=50421 RepID=UPI00273178EE|nr:type I-F CRISPR-associated protein Csy1 [Rhodoferax sp.]MDP1528088.1 type I-F CRISPR-associated protein Csy1 [Rhodoferax sp.]MDP1944089.1 type I-F CRISPR-associated protein Csy1 [Rhodoferax sp.]